MECSCLKTQNGSQQPSTNTQMSQAPLAVDHGLGVHGYSTFGQSILSSNP